MKCFYHEDREAVGTCQECGKSLCKECASKYTPVTCEDCHVAIVARARNEREKAKQDALIDSKSEIIKAIVIGIISSAIFVGFTYFVAQERDVKTLLYWAFWGLGFPWGWSLISRIIPTFYGSSDNIMLALILNVLKFAVALLIGIPAFFIQIIILIVKHVIVKKS